MTGENTENAENTEEQNLESSETAEEQQGSETESADEPENEEVDFSEFEKQMKQSGGADGSFDMDTVLGATKKPAEEEANEQEGEEETGEEGAEEEDADGKKEGAGGEKGEDTKYTKGGRLPKGIQSRMNRMKRKYETEIEGLKAQIESKGGEKEGDDKGAEATKGMPMVDEFDTVEAWMDAYDKWEQEAAKGGEQTSKGDDKAGKGSEETEETEETEEDDNPDPAYADMIEMLEDIDADSEDEDELSAQVQDLVESGRMALSDTMIDFILELEEDAQVRKVVDYLAARPSRSKAIARKSEKEQIERLESVVKEPEKKTATRRRKVPDQKEIHSQNQTVTPLEEEGDFSKFEQRMRKKQSGVPDFLSF